MQIYKNHIFINLYFYISMITIAKASDHVKPCNIEQSERHNRRDAEYIASIEDNLIRFKNAEIAINLFESLQK